MCDQGKYIKEKKWDCLVILDACRFDYFEKIYNDYLVGDLKKATSRAGATEQWLRENFSDDYYEDVIYVSANPFINSKGIDIVGFDGKKHFGKVVDAWEKHWDDDLKTVLPQGVGKATRLARAKFPEKKIISHFMQPHYPYISLGPVKEGISKTFSIAEKEKELEEKSFADKTRAFLGELLIDIIGFKNTQKLRKSLNLVNLDPVEVTAKEYGDEGLRKAYKDNLERVLSEVETLTDRLPGKIVVTADHGEFLGEEGIYSHPYKVDHPILREVPWLKVK